MRHLLFLLKLAVMVGLVYWLLDSGQVDFSALADQPFNALHLLGVSGIALSFLLSGYRWFLLLRVQLPHIRPLSAIKWGWIGDFFNLVTPGGGGGEVIRSYYAVKNHPEARIPAFSSVVLDRLIGLVSLLFLGVAAYAALTISGQAMTPATHTLGLTTLLALVVVLGGIIMLNLSFMRRLCRRFMSEDLTQAVSLMLRTYWQQKSVLVHSFALALVGHLLLVFPFWIAASILSVNMDYLPSLLVVPLSLVANLLPVSPGGIGVGEAAATYMFTQFDVVNGAGLMALFRLWMMVLQLGGGLWYLLEQKNDNPSMKATL